MSPVVRYRVDKDKEVAVAVDDADAVSVAVADAYAYYVVRFEFGIKMFQRVGTYLLKRFQPKSNSETRFTSLSLLPVTLSTHRLKVHPAASGYLLWTDVPSIQLMHASGSCVDGHVDCHT